MPKFKMPKAKARDLQSPQDPWGRDAEPSRALSATEQRKPSQEQGTRHVGQEAAIWRPPGKDYGLTTGNLRLILLVPQAAPGPKQHENQAILTEA